MNPLLNHLRSLGLTLGVAALLVAGAAQPSADSTSPMLGRASSAPVIALADDNGNLAPKLPPHQGGNGASITDADDNGNGTPTPGPKPGSVGAGQLAWYADDNGNFLHAPAIGHGSTNAPVVIVG